MVALLFTLACAQEAAPVEAHPFSLEDVNPTSGSYGERVAPADYAGQVSAWYFGHAT